jgi:hypothetical protein
MIIHSRSGLIKGVIHVMPSWPASDIGNAKTNSKTLVMNVNDDNLSCATGKGKVYKEKMGNLQSLPHERRKSEITNGVHFLSKLSSICLIN